MESRLPWVISVGVAILSVLGCFSAGGALGQAQIKGTFEYSQGGTLQPTAPPTVEPRKQAREVIEQISIVEHMIGFIDWENKMVYAVGEGVPPGSPTDLTAAERLTAARTAALVEALRALAESVTEVTSEPKPVDPSAGAGGVEAPDYQGLKGRLESRVHASLGGTLMVSGRSITENFINLTLETIVEWPARSGASAAGRIEVVDFTLVSPSVQNLDVYALLQKVQEAGITIVKWVEFQDGRVQVMVAASFSAFPEAVKSLRPPGEGQPEPTSEQEGVKASVPSEQEEARAEQTFTGLIVDARGLNARPALYPRILAEGGKTVYDIATPNPNAAIDEGLVEYQRALEEAQKLSRVGTNPIIVKAKQIGGKYGADIVLSEEDARKILDANRQGRFLSKAKVVVVID